MPANMEMCPSLESTLNDESRPYQDQVTATLCAWQSLGSVASHASQQALFRLINHIHSRSVELVLRGEWPQLPAAARTHLSVTVQRCAETLRQPPVTRLCSRLRALAADPWGGVELTQVLSGGAPPSNERLLAFCLEERPRLLALRLKILCRQRCDDIALHLAKQCVRCLDLDDKTFHETCSEVQRHFFVDVCVTLFFKYKRRDDIIALLKRRSGAFCAALLRRFATRQKSPERLWRGARKLVPFLSQLLLAQALLRPEPSDVHDIAVEWARQTLAEDGDNTATTATAADANHTSPSEQRRRGLQRLQESARKLSARSDSTRHLLELERALTHVVGGELRPLAIELCVRALTLATNRLEQVKLVAEEGAAAAQQQQAQCRRTLAQGFLRLAELTAENVRFCRECIMSAFSLAPTADNLARLVQLAGRQSDGGREERVEEAADSVVKRCSGDVKNMDTQVTSSGNTDGTNNGNSDVPDTCSAGDSTVNGDAAKSADVTRDVLLAPNGELVTQVHETSSVAADTCNGAVRHTQEANVVNPPGGSVIDNVSQCNDGVIIPCNELGVPQCSDRNETQCSDRRYNVIQTDESATSDDIEPSQVDRRRKSTTDDPSSSHVMVDPGGETSISSSTSWATPVDTTSRLSMDREESTKEISHAKSAAPISAAPQLTEHCSASRGPCVDLHGDCTGSCCADVTSSGRRRSLSTSDPAFVAGADGLIEQLRRREGGGDPPPAECGDAAAAADAPQTGAAADYDVMRGCEDAVDSLGVNEQLTADLIVLLSSARWKALSWGRDWDELYRICQAYLQDPEGLINTTKDLKYLEIDYSQFSAPKHDQYDAFVGIEKGYEQYLEVDSDGEEGGVNPFAMNSIMNTIDEVVESSAIETEKEEADSTQHSNVFKSNVKSSTMKTSYKNSVDRSDVTIAKKSGRRYLPSGSKARLAAEADPIDDRPLSRNKTDIALKRRRGRPPKCVQLGTEGKRVTTNLKRRDDGRCRGRRLARTQKRPAWTEKYEMLWRLVEDRRRENAAAASSTKQLRMFRRPEAAQRARQTAADLAGPPVSSEVAPVLSQPARTYAQSTIFYPRVRLQQWLGSAAQTTSYEVQHAPCAVRVPSRNSSPAVPSRNSSPALPLGNLSPAVSSRNLSPALPHRNSPVISSRNPSPGIPHRNLSSANRSLPVDPFIRQTGSPLPRPHSRLSASRPSSQASFRPRTPSPRQIPRSRASSRASSCDSLRERSPSPLPTPQCAWTPDLSVSVLGSNTADRPRTLDPKELEERARQEMRRAMVEMIKRRTGKKRPSPVHRPVAAAVTCTTDENRPSSAYTLHPELPLNPNGNSLLKPLRKNGMPTSPLKNVRIVRPKVSLWDTPLILQNAGVGVAQGDAPTKDITDSEVRTPPPSSHADYQDTVQSENSSVPVQRRVIAPIRHADQLESVPTPRSSLPVQTGVPVNQTASVRYGLACILASGAAVPKQRARRRDDITRAPLSNLSPVRSNMTILPKMSTVRKSSVPIRKVAPILRAVGDLRKSASPALNEKDVYQKISVSVRGSNVPEKELVSGQKREPDPEDVLRSSMRKFTMSKASVPIDIAKSFRRSGKASLTFTVGKRVEPTSKTGNSMERTASRSLKDSRVVLEDCVSPHKGNFNFSALSNGPPAVPPQEHIVFPVHSTSTNSTSTPVSSAVSSVSSTVSVAGNTAPTGTGGAVTTAAAQPQRRPRSRPPNSRNPSGSNSRKRSRTDSSTAGENSAGGSSSQPGPSGSASASNDGVTTSSPRGTPRGTISFQEVLRKVQEESAAAADRASAGTGLTRLLQPLDGAAEQETITLYRSQDTSVSQTFVPASGSLTSTLHLTTDSRSDGADAPSPRLPTVAARTRHPQVPEVKQVVIPAALQNAARLQQQQGQQSQLSRLLSQRPEPQPFAAASLPSPVASSATAAGQDTLSMLLSGSSTPQPTTPTPSSSHLSEILSRPLDRSVPRQVKTRELASLLTSGPSASTSSSPQPQPPPPLPTKQPESAATPADEGLVGRIADYLMRSSPASAAPETAPPPPAAPVSAAPSTSTQPTAPAVGAPGTSSALPAISSLLKVTNTSAASQAPAGTTARATSTGGGSVPAMQTGQVLVLNNQQKLPQTILLHGQQYTLVKKDSQVIYVPTARLVQAQHQALAKQQARSVAAAAAAAASQAQTAPRTTQLAAVATVTSAAAGAGGGGGGAAASSAATAPSPAAVSSTTLEQLREFESVLEAVSTRGAAVGSAGPPLELDPLVAGDLLGMTPEASPAAATASAPQQFVYPSSEQAAVDDESSRGSAGSGYGLLSTPGRAATFAADVPTTPTVTTPTKTKQKSTPSGSKAKQQASTPASKPKPVVTPTLVKTSPVKQELEDDQTRQRIAAILQQYQQDLACNPTPTPAPRNRKNPPVYTSRGGGDGASSKSKKKSPNKVKVETVTSGAAAGTSSASIDDDMVKREPASPAPMAMTPTPASTAEDPSDQSSSDAALLAASPLSAAVPESPGGGGGGGGAPSAPVTPVSAVVRPPASLPPPPPAAPPPPQQQQQYRTVRVVRLVTSSPAAQLLSPLAGSRQLIAQPAAVTTPSSAAPAVTALGDLLPPFHTLSSGGGATAAAWQQQPARAPEQQPAEPLQPPPPADVNAAAVGEDEQQQQPEQLPAGMTPSNAHTAQGEPENENSNEAVHIPPAAFFTEQLQSCLSTGEELSPQVQQQQRQLQLSAAEQPTPADTADHLQRQQQVVYQHQQEGQHPPDPDGEPEEEEEEPTPAGRLLDGCRLPLHDEAGSGGSEGSGPPTPLLSQSSVHVITGVLSSGGAAGPSAVQSGLRRYSTLPQGPTAAGEPLDDAPQLLCSVVPSSTHAAALWTEPDVPTSPSPLAGFSASDVAVQAPAPWRPDPTVLCRKRVFSGPLRSISNRQPLATTEVLTRTAIPLHRPEISKQAILQQRRSSHIRSKPALPRPVSPPPGSTASGDESETENMSAVVASATADQPRQMSVVTATNQDRRRTVAAVRDRAALQTKKKLKKDVRCRSSSSAEEIRKQTPGRIESEVSESKSDLQFTETASCTERTETHSLPSRLKSESELKSEKDPNDNVQSKLEELFDETCPDYRYAKDPLEVEKKSPVKVEVKHEVDSLPESVEMTPDPLAQNGPDLELKGERAARNLSEMSEHNYASAHMSSSSGEPGGHVEARNNSRTMIYADTCDSFDDTSSRVPDATALSVYDFEASPVKEDSAVQQTNLRSSWKTIGKQDKLKHKTISRSTEQSQRNTNKASTDPMSTNGSTEIMNTNDAHPAPRVIALRSAPTSESHAAGTPSTRTRSQKCGPAVAESPAADGQVHASKLGWASKVLPKKDPNYNISHVSSDDPMVRTTEAHVVNSANESDVSVPTSASKCNSPDDLNLSPESLTSCSEEPLRRSGRSRRIRRSHELSDPMFASPPRQRRPSSRQSYASGDSTSSSTKSTSRSRHCRSSPTESRVSPETHTVPNIADASAGVPARPNWPSLEKVRGLMSSCITENSAALSNGAVSPGLRNGTVLLDPGRNATVPSADPLALVATDQGIHTPTDRTVSFPIYRRRPESTSSDSPSTTAFVQTSNVVSCDASLVERTGGSQNKISQATIGSSTSSCIIPVHTVLPSVPGRGSPRREQAAENRQFADYGGIPQTAGEQSACESQTGTSTEVVKPIQSVRVAGKRNKKSGQATRAQSRPAQSEVSNKSTRVPAASKAVKSKVTTKQSKGVTDKSLQTRPPELAITAKNAVTDAKSVNAKLSNAVKDAKKAGKISKSPAVPSKTTPVPKAKAKPKPVSSSKLNQNGFPAKKPARSAAQTPGQSAAAGRARGRSAASAAAASTENGTASRQQSQHRTSSSARSSLPSAGGAKKRRAPPTTPTSAQVSQKRRRPRR